MWQAKQAKRVKDTPTSEALGILHNFLGRIWLKESAKERLSLHTAQNCGTPTTKLPIKEHKKIGGRKAHCAVAKGRPKQIWGHTPTGRVQFASRKWVANQASSRGWQTRDVQVVALQNPFHACVCGGTPGSQTTSPA